MLNFTVSYPAEKAAAKHLQQVLEGVRDGTFVVGDNSGLGVLGALYHLLKGEELPSYFWSNDAHAAGS